MNISETDAKVIVGDYVSSGGEQHFVFNGNRISAFTFTREQIMDLLKTADTELFIMLALSKNRAKPSEEYLNLVLGSKLHDLTDMRNLIVSDDEPHTIGVSFSHLIKPKSKLPYGDFITMKDRFNTASDDELTSIKGYKIKAYTVEKADLISLALNIPVDTSNKDDIFVFVPVIRSADPTTPFDRPFLSFAVAQIDYPWHVAGYVIDYCLPCPKACASNYWY